MRRKSWWFRKKELRRIRLGVEIQGASGAKRRRLLSKIATQPKKMLSDKSNKAIWGMV
jgi:hypothetical protein